MINSASFRSVVPAERNERLLFITAASVAVRQVPAWTRLDCAMNINDSAVDNVALWETSATA